VLRHDPESPGTGIPEQLDFAIEHGILDGDW
jgi:hypothetical protein